MKNKLTALRAALFLMLLILPVKGLFAEENIDFQGFPSTSLNAQDKIKEQLSVNWKEPETLFITQFGASLIWKGLVPHGIDLTLDSEWQLVPHLAVKLLVKEEWFWDNGFADQCLASSFSGWAVLYPMSNQMRKLYVGIGGGIDYFDKMDGFLNFTHDTGWVLSFTPYVGYRFTLPLYFMVDVHVGYKFPYALNCELEGLSEKFLGQGWLWGFTVTRTWSFAKAIRASRAEKKAAKQAAKAEEQENDIFQEENDKKNEENP